jgi:translation initiation factor IF-2
MAKIRIYELARDLNMSNKLLIEKMNAIGIPVSSHMGSLDDETVATIRNKLFGAPVEEVEETRVRPTVIRRRRIAVVKPAEAELELPSQEEAAGAAEEEVPAPELPAEETAPAVEASAEEAAPAAEAVPAEPAPEEEAVKIEGVPPIEETPAPEPPAEEPAPRAAAEAPEEAAAVSPEEMPASPPAEGEAEAPPEKTQEAPAVVEPPAKKAKPKKVSKKQKKEAPAKIVALPVTPVAPPPKAGKPAATDWEPAESEVGKTAVEAVEAPAKGKKKKREELAEDQDRDRKFFKKKITFRKKEVVEGAALYGKGRRDRKGRKAAKGKAAVLPMKTQITTPKAIKRRIKIDEAIVLADLAKRMGIKAGEIIMKLMGMGVMATVNQTVDFETASLVAAEFDYEVEKAAFEEESLLKTEVEDDPGALTERPPVVTIMGHVDHGKTSLLDVIRKTRVTDIEAGGITQHIGAYRVSTDRGQVVFLDTPGHEAFTAMRLRGAKVTDIVVLVVAADDGVMPQTVEAINHARMAEVPIIVAVNKIDKANADPERVRRGLAELDLVPEEWGGETVFLNVSAKMNEGIDDLLEMILLQAEMLELKANPDKLAMGHVVEAKLDSGKGPVATVLVQEGTLRLGDSVVCGIHHGKIRALLDDMGMQAESAGPSTPVEIIGLSGVPNAGDEIIAVADEKDAKQVSAHRAQKQRSKELAKTSRLSLEKLYEKMREGEVKDLNLIIKADVKGSIEALADSLVKLSNNEVKINVIHSGTGTITESDVSLAAVSNAIIIGFNVRPSQKVTEFAAEENVDMRFYNVIYNVIQEVKDAIVGMMASTFEERILGRAEVREVFHVPKVGTIAGSYVTDGKLERGKQVRLIRDGVITFDGKLATLRRFKDDVKEVQSGYECGVRIEGYNDIKVQDQIECYYLEEIKPEID